MHIAQLVNTLEIGGLERMAVDLALGLRRRGHAVSVFCLRFSGPLEAPLRDAGVQVISLNKPEGFHISSLRRLASQFAALGLDVVHTHNPLVHHYGMLAARMARVPALINTRHGLGNFPRSAKTEAIYEATSLFTDRIVSVSKHADAYFRTHSRIAAHKLTTVYNGIPTEVFAPSNGHRKPQQDFVFGSVGRLAEVKNYRGMIEAFATVLKARPQCRLEVLGDGPLRQSLEAASEQLGVADSVRFRGASADVSGFLHQIDAFVLNSESEGSPMTILEAMASGLPVIATRVGGIPELIETSGCGWLCGPSQSGELAEAMVAAIDSPQRQEMGRRGLEHVLAHHTLDRMSEHYEQIYAEVLEQKGRRAAA
jgi:glycosyltransferase involved in cell wall biosynthesis